MPESPTCNTSSPHRAASQFNATAASKAGHHADGLTGDNMHAISNLPTHPYLMHPLTGCPLRAVGVVAGRPVWPILGGSEPGAGGEGGAGSGGTGSEGWTPPASQEDLDRIINKAVGRAHAKYADYDELKASKERLDQLEHDLSSEKDKAVSDARKDERAKTADEFSPRLVRAEFRHAAKGVLSDEQRDALLEDLDLSKYVTDKGEVDEEKVAKKVAALAGGSGNGSGTGTGNAAPPRQLGQGNQPPSQTKPGDQGRAMAEKRFGTKKQ